MKSIDLQSDWRMLASCWLLAIASVFILLTYFAPSDYYRDIFFYADKFVSSQIVSTGHVPPEPQAEHLNSWGKIGTRTRLPVFPIMLAMYSLVTGLAFSPFYLYMPAFLFLGLFILLFLDQLNLLPFQAHLLAISSGMALPATVIYTVSATELGRALVVLSCYFIYRTAQSLHRRAYRGVFMFQVLLVITVTTLFFWYPPHYGKILFVSGLLISLFTLRGETRVGILILPVIGGFLFLQIFSLSIMAYQHYILLAIKKILASSFTLPTGGAGYGTEIATSYYGLLPLVILIPFGVYGGYLVIQSATMYLWKGESLPEDVPIPYGVVGTCWGLTVIAISLAYMATSTGFLITRPYLFALPVIFLGAAVGVNRLSVSAPRLSTAVSICLIILVISSVGLQTTTQGVGIQTYGSGQEEVSRWVTDYEPGLIYTDTVRGAPLAAVGYFNAIYPETKSQLLNFFYRDYQAFINEFQSKGADAVLVSPKMTSEGIFAASRSNVPISDKGYQKRIKYSSKVYSSGSQILLIPRPTSRERPVSGRS